MRLRVLALLGCFAACGSPDPVPSLQAIEARMRAAMAEAHANGIAMAVIDEGRVAGVWAHGVRNAKNEPLQTDTVMYGASLTKTVMAYATLTLVDRGVLGLDAPLASYLDRPLTEYGDGDAHLAKYGPYRDLAGDDRWRRITARMALTHSTGFENFWFVEPDRKLRIHFDPGSRFSYSGEGFSLLQFVIEHGSRAKGLGEDVKALTDGIFARLGMTRTSLQWRSDFRPNLADGWRDDGQAVEHDERSNVRVAGSMDTTIDDLSKFAAALVRGDGLSPAARAELTKPGVAITTAHQFPTFGMELPIEQRRRDLAAGLGVIVFDGPQGPGFFKGGHDAQTANTLVCVERRQRCVLILANDVRAESRFADLVSFVLGETGVPYDWEYGSQAGKS
ncbi:MAG: beta-lactamase family protein [Acidobacteria bacterium]|nr:beta-lactamase family protein [Acidobacteriota bacterium]